MSGVCINFTNISVVNFWIMEDFRVYDNVSNNPNKITNKVAWETLRKLFSSWSVNPELKRDFTHIEVQRLMEEYHARMMETGGTFTPYFPEGFVIDLKEYRLGSTKGKGILLLHPDDYKQFLPTDESV